MRAFIVFIGDYKKMFCQYRHIFGVEGEGAHSYRLFNIAIVDLALTILGSWLIAHYLQVSFWVTLAVVLIIGTLMHRLFCVRTTITKFVFPKLN